MAVPAAARTAVVAIWKVLTPVGMAKYVVPDVIPVGSAPVVVKTTGDPVTRPWEVHVTTPGVAMVIVTVAVPTVLAKAVENMRLPATPAPVLCEPVNVQSAPAVLEVPATTDCTDRVCGTAVEASAAPKRRLAIPLRERMVSVPETEPVLDHFTASVDAKSIPAEFNEDTFVEELKRLI